MSFRLVPKSVTLNDLEQRNGVILPYFSEFGYLPGVLHKSSHSLSHLLVSSCYLTALFFLSISRFGWVYQKRTTVRVRFVAQQWPILAAVYVHEHFQMTLGRRAVSLQTLYVCVVVAAV